MSTNNTVLEPHWNPVAIKTLTDRMCEGMKAPKGERLEVRDGKTSGLIFRVTANGKKSWALLYRRKSDGKRRRYTFDKDYPALGLHAARQQALALRARILSGDDPAGERNALKAADTFTELADRYIERHAKKNKRSWCEDRRIIDHDLNPHIGAMRLHEIRRRDIINILDAVTDRGAPIMSNRVLACVRGIFRWAESEDLIDHAPVSGIKPRTAERPRDRVLNDDELKKFWTAIPLMKVMDGVADALRLCALLGQRVGEVTGAARSEFDLTGALWRIPPERTKNGRAHVVPLPALALEIVERNLAGHNLQPLFPSPSVEGPLSSTAPNRALARAGNILDLPKFTVHDLRRTVASGLAHLGIDRLTIGKVLNHATIDRETITGTVYDHHSYLPEKRRALEAWEIQLRMLLGQSSGNGNVVALALQGDQSNSELRD